MPVQIQGAGDVLADDKPLASLQIPQQRKRIDPVYGVEGRLKLRLRQERAIRFHPCHGRRAANSAGETVLGPVVGLGAVALAAGQTCGEAVGAVALVLRGGCVRVGTFHYGDGALNVFLVQSQRHGLAVSAESIALRQDGGQAVFGVYITEGSAAERSGTA